MSKFKKKNKMGTMMRLDNTSRIGEKLIIHNKWSKVTHIIIMIITVT